MEITTDFKVGKTTPKSWAQVYGYKPDDKNLLAARGMIVAVMSISSEIDFDLPNVGNWLFDELQESYYGDDLGTNKMLHFEEAIKSLKSRLDNILAREQELAETGIDLEFAVGVVIENVLYMAVIGESKFYITRGNQTADVSRILVDPNMDGFMRTGSMVLEPDDRMLLSTSKVLIQNSESNLEDAASQFDLTDTKLTDGAVIMCGYELTHLPAVKPVPVESPLEEDIAEFQVEEAITAAPEEVIHEEDQVPYYGDLEAEVPYQQDDLEGEDWQTTELPQAQTPVAGPSTVSKIMTGLQPAGLKLKSVVVSGAAFAQQKLRGIRSQTSQPAYEMPDQFTDDTPVNQYIPERRVLSGSPAQIAVQRVVISIQNLIAKLRGGNMPVRGRGGRATLNWKVLSVVILVVLVALFLGIRKVSQDRERTAQVQGVQTQLTDLNSRYQSLSIQVNTVNSNTTDTQKQTLANQLDSLIIQGQSLLTQNISTTDITKVVSQAQTAKDKLLGIKSFTQPQLVNDLGANFAGANPADIIYFNGNIFALDKAKGAVYRMGTSIGSEANPLASGMQQPYLMAMTSDGQIAVLDHSSDSVLAIIDLASGTVERAPGLSASKMGNISAMDIWSNGALYTINPDKKALLKQENIAGTFQFPDAANPWREDSDFQNAIDMAADFWMYVLVKGKGVERYLAGDPSPYTLTGITAADQTALSQATAMDITATHLFIADSVNKRIFSFAKDTDDGDVFHFDGQYVYRGDGSTFSNIKEISVNQANGQMFVLDGAQVIRVDL